MVHLTPEDSVMLRLPGFPSSPPLSFLYILTDNDFVARFHDWKSQISFDRSIKLHADQKVENFPFNDYVQGIYYESFIVPNL